MQRLDRKTVASGIIQLERDVVVRVACDETITNGFDLDLLPVTV